MARGDSGVIWGVSRPVPWLLILKIVPKRSQTVLVGGDLQSGQNVRIKLRGRKGFPRRCGETYQGMHQSQLSWMVEFQARNPSATGKHRGLRQLTQLASIDEGLQDVLLDREIIVAGSPAYLAVGAGFPQPS